VGSSTETIDGLRDGHLDRVSVASSPTLSAFDFEDVEEHDDVPVLLNPSSVNRSKLTSYFAYCILDG